MHFKIIVANGHFPLTYSCSTAYEAFGCIEALSTGFLQDMEFDMDQIMQQLLDMKNGKLLSFEKYKLRVVRVDGEI